MKVLGKYHFTCSSGIKTFYVILLPYVLYCIHFKGRVHVLTGQVKIYKALILQEKCKIEGAQWLSGRVLDSRLRGRRFEPHQFHCVVYLCKTH